MTTEWYYASEGKQYGPAAVSELKALVSSGEISPSDLVWNESMPEWKPINEILGLCEPRLAGVKSGKGNLANQKDGQISPTIKKLDQASSGHPTAGYSASASIKT